MAGPLRHALVGGLTAGGVYGAVLSVKADAAYYALESQILSAGAQGLSILRGTTVNVGDLTAGEKDRIKDAFRHSYASGHLTMLYGPSAATIFDLNELNPLGETNAPAINQDLWNNREARTFSTGATDTAEVVSRILSAMATNALILDPINDTRSYVGSIIDEATALNLSPIKVEDLFDDIGDISLPDLGSPVFAIAEWAVEIISKIGLAATNTSPLVLDLDGDGIELTSLSSNGAVYWDIDVDGYAEASGWVDGGDGLLAIDLNANGLIDNNLELFGNNSVYSNGFLALQQYDSNSDGFITSADSVWSKLLIWVDSNGDASSQTLELHSLDSLLITSISLNYTNVNYTNDGNYILQEATFIKNGVSRSIVDAYFSTSQINTIYDGEVGFDLRAGLLPSVRGYGVLPLINVAASNDNIGTGNLFDRLKALKLAAFSTTFDDNTSVLDAVKAIMFRWAGVDGVSPTSRGEFIDARELAFLEKFTGQGFVQQGWMTDPGQLAAEDLKAAFVIALNNIAARLVVQSAGGALFNGDWHYDVATDSLLGVTSINSTTLSNLSTLAASQSNLELFWQNVIRMVEFTVGVSSLSTADQNALESAINGSNPSLHLTDIVNSLDYESPTGVTLNGTTAANTLTGGVGNDTIDGKEGNDTLNGGIGNDVIYGGAGTDTITGGTGGDTLFGGTGSDTYKYNLGDGWDTIVESGTGTGNTTDKILFGAGISLSHLTFTRMGNYDLVIDINTGSQTGKIIIEDQFNSSGLVETLSFNGASTYTLTSQVYTMYGSEGDDILLGVTSGGSTNDIIYGQGGNDRITSDAGADTVYGGAGNDYIVGGAGNDILRGDDGDDTIYGEGDNDTIYGGAGSDYMDGGTGNDTYYYVSGKDRINDSTGTDILMLDAVWNGITPQYLRLGYDLRVFFNPGSYIDIINQYNGAPVESMKYANNTTVNLTTIPYVSQGTSGDDNMAGDAANNTMYGFGGNDSISAGDGNDLVYGGDGNDTIDGYYGNDTLYGEAGNDVIYGQGGNDYLDGGAGDDWLMGGTENDTYFYTSGIDRIEEQSGTDVIKVVAGYDLEDAVFVRRIEGPTNVGDLRIEFSPTNYIWIRDYFYGPGYGAESITFADLTTIMLNTLSFATYGSSAGESIYGIEEAYNIGLPNDTIYGYGGNDYIVGYGGNDKLYGGDGADSIYGGNDNDYLYGEAGNDYMLGEAGDDILSGGAGNDTLYGDAGEDMFIYDSGLDTIYDAGYNGLSDTLKIANTTTIDSITFANLSTYDTKITISAGVNEITVKDLRMGGNYYVVEYVEFADGFKTTLPNYASWTKGTTGNNTLTGTANADTILGLAGTDTINGGAGNDAIHGGAGNDTVSGGDGDDIVHGGVGNDTVNGNNNNDILYGGDGLDQLYGGTGADTFMFMAASAYNNIDVINDFSLAQSDKINVKDLLSQYNPLTDSITNFIQITTSGTNSLLKIDADGDGNSFLQIATIKNVTGLTDEAALVASGNLIV